MTNSFPIGQRAAKRVSRHAFTLLELILALSLVVVATALLTSLMQLYARDFATRGEDIRRQQLARAMLHMIAEDIRAVVVEQEYDGSALEQMLGGGGGGGAGGAGGDPTAAGAGDAAGLASDTMDAGGGNGGDYGAEGDLSETASTTIPPGIYGDQYSLMIDVSRIPRPDEYLREQVSLIEGSLADVPGDIKTVTYFIQQATNQGVTDSMAVFTRDTTDASVASGLVRRALDRRVTAYAEESGDTDRLLRTGDLVAPEVIAIDFSYFDGAEWVYEWDSSQQSLPWLVQISLAMQSATATQTAQLPPGTPIATMPIADRQAYGVEVYELTVAIPGAQLSPADAAAPDQSAGLGAMGL